MSSRQQAPSIPQRLLAKCKAKPDEHKPRRALADWLETHGQADWAELVRLQVARQGPNFMDVDGICAAREYFLRYLVGEKWGEPFREYVKWVFFERGLTRVRVSPEQAYALDRHVAEELLDCVEEVEVEHGKWKPAQLRRLLSCGWLANLGGLSFERSDFTLAAMKELAAAPVLAQHRSLKFSWLKMAAGALPLLLASHYLGRLRRLDFDNVPLSKPGAVALAGSPILEQLTALRLHFSLKAPAMRTVAQTRRATKLRELDLGFNEFDQAATAALADSPLLDGCERLNLEYGHLDDGAIARLAGSPRLATLRSMNLMCNRVGPEGIEALCRTPHLPRLISLNLWGNPLGASGVSSLVASPLVKHLEHLHLAQTRLRAEGLRVLLGSRQLGNLDLLDLCCNDLTPLALEGEDLEAAGPGPRRLDLSSNRLHDHGAELLGRLTWLDTLEELELSKNKITAPGLRALLGTGRLGKLRRFCLWENGVGTEGARILARCPQMTELTALNLGYNRLDVAGIQALVNSPFLNKLRYLDLRGNRIGRTIAAVLRERFGNAIEV